MSLYFYVCKIKVKVWVDFKHIVHSIFLYDMFAEPILLKVFY